MKVALALSLPLVAAATSNSTYNLFQGTVFYDATTDTATIKEGHHNHGHAHVKYEADLFKDGWNKVNVWGRVSNGRIDARSTGFSAGFAEGYATQHGIWNMYQNNYADWFLDQGDSGYNPKKHLLGWQKIGNGQNQQQKLH